MGGLTQLWLAQLANMSPGDICAIEHGVKKLRVSHTLAAADRWTRIDVVGEGLGGLFRLVGRLVVATVMAQSEKDFARLK